MSEDKRMETTPTLEEKFRSVKRKLFPDEGPGPLNDQIKPLAMDASDEECLLPGPLIGAAALEAATKRWNFDFANERPLVKQNSRDQTPEQEWTRLPLGHIPAFYQGLKSPFTPIKYRPSPPATPRRTSEAPSTVAKTPDRIITRAFANKLRTSNTQSTPEKMNKAPQMSSTDSSIKGYFGTKRRMGPPKAVPKARQSAPPAAKRTAKEPGEQRVTVTHYHLRVRPTCKSPS